MTTNCKGCGRPMVWGLTEDGKKIPMDPRPPVYRLLDKELGLPGETARVERIPHGTAMVSHFATCSKAAQFSASKKKQQALFNPPA